MDRSNLIFEQYPLTSTENSSRSITANKPMEKQSSEYECEICGTTFKDADALTKHMQIHGSTRDKLPDAEEETQHPSVNPRLPLEERPTQPEPMPETQP